MKYVLCFFVFIWFSPLVSSEMTLSSEGASYNGKNLILEGNVVLHHGLGILRSGEAFLKKEKEEGDLPFSVIELKNAVNILLTEKTRLFCDTARLDFVSLIGELKGSSEVIYEDTLENTKGSLIPLKICSAFAHLSFAKKEEEALSYTINTLTAHEKVHVQYGLDLSLQADEALYDHEKKLIVAYPKKTTTYALMQQGQSSVMSSYISLALDESFLLFKTPEGKVPSSLFSEELEGSLSFKADLLTWNEEKKTLTLEGAVELEEPHLGKIYAKEQLVIVQEEGKEGFRAKILYVKGPSRLVHENGTLYCPKLLHINEIKGQLTALGSETTQLLYEQDNLKLRADTAFLEYSAPSYTLASLLLKNNISLLLDDGCAAIADRLSYSPYTKTIILYAAPGKKVLFYDKKQDLSMSADEVHITEHPETAKPEVRGVGHVRLQFSSEEASLLEKTFSLHKEPSNGSN